MKKRDEEFLNNSYRKVDVSWLSQDRFIIKEKAKPLNYATLVTVTEDKTYKCNQCGKKFNNRSNSYKHIKAVHIKQKTLTCVLCAHKTESTSNMSKHLNTHPQARRFEYRCTTCNKGFNNSDNAKIHAITHKMKEANRINCLFDGCKYFGFPPPNFKKHIREQHGILSFQEYQEKIHEQIRSVPAGDKCDFTVCRHHMGSGVYRLVGVRHDCHYCVCSLVWASDGPSVLRRYYRKCSQGRTWRQTCYDNDL